MAHKTFWKKEKPKAYGMDKEEHLQSFTDQYLDIQRIKYYRIPDKFFKWLNATAPQWAKSAFNSVFAGMPDNMCIIPISDDYCLCLNLELKSKRGKLHGRQRPNAMRFAWQVARTHEEVQAIVEEYQKTAATIRDWLRSQSEAEPEQEPDPQPPTDSAGRPTRRAGW